jgi:thioredoxin-like negative regulator of GroEL
MVAGRALAGRAASGLAAAAVAGVPPAAIAGGEPLAAATDLQALAAESSRTRTPIILLFSTPGCPFCAEVRSHYLAPRLAAATGAPRLLVREIDITSRAPVVDADGRATTQAELADRFGVRMVPVVMALDARGRPLGEPLVGLDRSGFYESYLQSLIDRAQRQFQR